jgi:hypothetical protein
VRGGKKGKGEKAYSRVYNVLIARIVVNIDCDAPERGDFGGEFVEAGVVLSSIMLSVVVSWDHVRVDKSYCSRS